MINIRKLETDLWASADLLRAGSKLTSNQYCMPVLGLLFLRYAYSRFKLVEKEILANRPVRNGRVLPVEASDFNEKSALFLPQEAQYPYLVNLPENIGEAQLLSADGLPINSLGEAVNNAMHLIEQQSEQLLGVLPQEYTMFSDELLTELLRIFNNDALDEIGGDVFGRIYEYFLNKFAKNIASDDGVFFTPKSLVNMIVNVLEPTHGILLDPACGSGGMFVQTGDFVNQTGMAANNTMTFYGQEKVEYNAKLCLMNMAVHGLDGRIVSGDGANTFYNDAHDLEGCCDYVMANPPFNVDKVKAESAEGAGRLPFGMPAVNKSKEVGNGNYLWISYFYAYLKETGRAGFVMASSSTDSQGKDKDIREQLVKTGHVDAMVSVGNNFFYTKSLPCSLWFFDKGKLETLKDKILFIDARNYYTEVDRTLNEWSEWQLKNLNAIVRLYRGEIAKYKSLLLEYKYHLQEQLWKAIDSASSYLIKYLLDQDKSVVYSSLKSVYDKLHSAEKLSDFCGAQEPLEQLKTVIRSMGEHTLEENGKLSAKDFGKWYKDQTGESLVFRFYKKAVAGAMEEMTAAVDEMLTVLNEAKFLTDRFGEGEYQDIPGLCKIASRKDVEDKNWSLTPGAYVGVAEAEDDGVDFAERMHEIHAELLTLQQQSNELMEKISANFKELRI